MITMWNVAGMLPALDLHRKATGAKATAVATVVVTKGVGKVVGNRCVVVVVPNIAHTLERY